MKSERHKFLAALLATAFILGTARSAEIHDAAKADDVARITELLAADPKLVHLPGDEGATPLHSAARQGKMKAVALLLEYGADVNAPDTHGCRPLHSAVYGRHTLVAEFLLDHQADVNATRTDGVPPLYYAARDGDTNLVSLLLKRGAKPDATSATGFTLLHVAAKAGRTAVVEMLVAAGASVDAKDRDGHTPLHVAAKAGNRAMAECLLSHGADADAKDRLRFKPLDYVAGVTNAALASILEQHMKSRQEQSLPEKVGEAGDPDRISFEGLRTFTAEQVRHALAVKPGYLLAAHPQANLRAFFDELKVMVESGYQAAGFPEARAAVRYDPPAFRAQVKVTEGPRFTARKIRVIGTKSASVAELVRWFTTPATSPESKETLKAVSASTPVKGSGADEAWNFRASASLTVNRRSVLNTPGKAGRPDDPMWVAGDPADFSIAWATQAVAQVESCLAEQGFFFPKAEIELQRDAAAGAADLLITIQREGPPGVIGEINVTGTKRHAPGDVLRFLNLRQGTKITAARLAAARQKLRDCVRFEDFEITPEYTGVGAVASRRVNLRIEVKELEGVPPLNEPLAPVQQALVRLCKWVEQFPARDEDIQVTVSNQTEIPFAVDFVLSPRRGLLLNSSDLGGCSPVSAGFLLKPETVEFCAWASGRKLDIPRGGVGLFFLHLLPDRSGGSNRFNFTVGAGYKGKNDAARTGATPMLDFDVQLAPAAFLDLVAREGGGCSIEGRTLVLSNASLTLRAEAATGRLIEIRSVTNRPFFDIRFGVRAWDQARREFTRRSAPLTNIYAPDHGLSSFLALAMTEAVRWKLTEMSSGVNAEQRARAVTAMRKLVNPEFLFPVDRLLGRDETNTFSIPMDEVDQAIQQNSLAAFFSGFAFEASTDFFSKYSWPWTVTRETAFVMLSQGRYTDAELDRLYNAEETGPIGCLVIAQLLAVAGSPTSKTFAQRGHTRLGTEDFLRDCNLFLRGESGLARSFARTAEALRNLPEDELAALVAVLPGAEANLLRESASALRARPDASPATVLAPALGKYWEERLRAKVRESLRRLTAPPKGRGPVRT